MGWTQASDGHGAVREECHWQQAKAKAKVKIAGGVRTAGCGLLSTVYGLLSALGTALALAVRLRLSGVALFLRAAVGRVLKK